MSAVARRKGYSFRVTDLDYPAVEITATTGIGAYVAAGKSFKFGKSVAAGVKNLRTYYRTIASKCDNDTRWVLGGYSQGAMVVAEAVKSFSANRVVYVALFGDPQLYLPEGRGLLPAACLGRQLSSYRASVPNCRTSKGILGARDPYEYPALVGKYGTWCNLNDAICGSSSSLLRNSGHMQYAKNGSFSEAAVKVGAKLGRKT